MIGDHLTRLVAAPMMTPSGPSATSGDVRCCAGVGSNADISPQVSLLRNAVEELGEQALRQHILGGRPTSLLSKLGLALRPELFIPYDTRVRLALRAGGHKVKDRCYSDYMSAVVSERSAFVA